MAGCVSRTVHVGQLSLECQVNSALHPSGVAESSTSCGWGKGGNVTSAGWQVTLCDPMWHVSYRSGVATLRTAIHLLLTYLLTSTTTTTVCPVDRQQQRRAVGLLLSAAPVADIDR